MIKIKILNSLSERAKWRETNFSRELTKEKLANILSSNKIENLFVHFDNGVTDKSVPQATFNPQTTYNTPIGIYAYPMSYVKNKLIPKKDDLTFGDSGIPFASEFKWVYIYKAKNDSQVYTFERAIKEGLFEKSISLLYDSHPSEKIFDTLLSAADVDNIKLDPKNSIDLKNLIEKKQTIPKDFIKLTGKGASAINKAHLWWFFLYQIFNKNKVSVTVFLQNKLNVKILVDNGAGIIHENEPAQVIIFNPAYVDLISVELNPWRKSRNKPLNIGEKNLNLTKEILDSMPLEQIEKYFLLNKNKIAFNGMYGAIFNHRLISSMKDKNKAIKVYTSFIKIIMNRAKNNNSDDFLAIRDIILNGLQNAPSFRKKLLVTLFELLKNQNLINLFINYFTSAIDDLGMQKTPLGMEVTKLYKLANSKKKK